MESAEQSKSLARYHLYCVNNPAKTWVLSGLHTSAMEGDPPRLLCILPPLDSDKLMRVFSFSVLMNLTPAWNSG